MTGLADQPSIHLLPVPPGCPILVAAARVPNLQPGDTARRFAAGWGMTAEAAIASCSGEVAERASAQINGEERIHVCPIAALAGMAVAPPQLMLFHPAQSASRAEGADWPAGPWQPERAIGWVAADEARSMQPAWIPAGLCFLGHADDRAAGLLPADSNGLAAGETREDAAIRAFLELVERDAVAIWWYNRLVRPAIDPLALGDALVTRYADWVAAQARVLRLIDLTHDLGIPVVAAVSHDHQGGHIALGFGAGFDATAAARHALGEMTQLLSNIALIGQRVSTLNGAGQDGVGQGENDLAPEVLHLWHWWGDARIADLAHLNATTHAGLPSAVNIGDLAACHDLCRRHGLTFLAVDLTRAAIGTPVMRVLVPGLRPMAPRFAPGRLYDVPVKLGWLKRPLSWQELNPVPIPF